jgi:hypothetical protein
MKQCFTGKCECTDCPDWILTRKEWAIAIGFIVAVLATIAALIYIIYWQFTHLPRNEFYNISIVAIVGVVIMTATIGYFLRR